MSKYLPAVLAALVIGAVTFATVPKVWTFREVLTSSDLNGNFSYLDTATVDNTADIAQLQNEVIGLDAGVVGVRNTLNNNLNGIPDAWSTVETPCTINGACIIAQSFNVTSVTRTGTGVYTIVLAYTPVSASFGIMAVSFPDVGAAAQTVCVISTKATSSPHATVTCRLATTGAATDSRFVLTVFDSNHSN